MQTRTLGIESVRAERLSRLTEPHVAPLTAFAERLEFQVGRYVPQFDPGSGGLHARVLLLLESPSPRIVESGVVSLDNPTRTAENLSCLVHLSGLRRRDVLLWNAVPWLLGERVTVPTEADLLRAAPYTLELLAHLPDLQAVVLVGRRAERGWRLVAPLLPRPLPTLSCPHPSPVNFAPRPEAAVTALAALVEAGRLTRQNKSDQGQ